MTDKAIGPLRRRMIEDMTARHFAEKVQTDYIRHVKNFAAFLGRSPDAATGEELRLYHLHMTKTHVSPPSIDAAVAALRFFFRVTLERDDLVRRLTSAPEPRRAPIVSSPEEVARLLAAAAGVKYKAALGVAYGAGLRVSEVVALKVSDIDSQRMTPRVEQGNGDKDRYVMLSPRLLELLRDWRLLRRLFLEKLIAAFDAGRSQFFAAHADLPTRAAFTAFPAPLRTVEWVVYAKRPFGGPEAVLAYLARYTHRVAISDNRLTALRDGAVAFKWKDYRVKGRDRHKTMTLAVPEFIRRFLVHVLPSGFHRFRHYGLFASGARPQNIAQARRLLATAARTRQDSHATDPGDADPPTPSRPCPMPRRPHDRHRDLRTRRLSAPRFAQPDQDRYIMIENALPATSRHRALLSLAVRQRGRSSLNGALQLPLPRQKHAIPDTEAGNRPASRSPNPAKPQSIFASSARSPPPAIPKSP